MLPTLMCMGIFKLANEFKIKGFVTRLCGVRRVFKCSWLELQISRRGFERFHLIHTKYDFVSFVKCICIIYRSKCTKVFCFCIEICNNKRAKFIVIVFVYILLQSC